MPKLSWTTVMERALLQTLVDQVRSGKRAESGFKKEAWAASLEQVQLVAQHPDLVTLKKSKDKVDNLKAKWNMWVKLRYEVSGWGWDETTQLFIASAEQWDRYIEVSSGYNVNVCELIVINAHKSRLIPRRLHFDTLLYSTEIY